MSYLKVLYKCSRDHYESDGEQYGSWEASNSHEIEGIVVVPKGSSYDLVREDDVKDGDILYLVVVQYSTGDSFGNESGLVEFVDTFRTLEKARACLKAVKNSNDTTLVYIMDNGAEYRSSYTSWSGYFDSLEDVYIKELVVGRQPGKIR